MITKRKVNVALCIVIILIAMVFVPRYASAYDPADGAWLPKVKEAKLTNTSPDYLETRYLKLERSLIPNEGEDGRLVYSGYPIAYFAKAHNESTGDRQYAILYHRWDARIAGDPGATFLATLRFSKGGEYEVARQERFSIEDYANEKTAKAIGGFSVSDGWMSQENFVGSDLGQSVKEGLEKAAKAFEGYSIKPICYLADQFRSEYLEGEDKDIKKSAILCNVKNEKKDAYATQVVILKWKEDGSVAEIENMTSVLEDSDFLEEIPPLTVKKTEYRLGTYGTGLIGPPYQASNKLVKAESSNSKVVSAWVNDGKIWPLKESDPEELFFLETVGHTPGKATVTLTDIYGQSIVLNVTVVNDWPAPDFGVSEIKMIVGETKELGNRGIWGSNIETLTVSDPELLSVERGPDGRMPHTGEKIIIKARKAGTAVITARTGKGKETVLKVTVDAEKDPISPNPQNTGQQLNTEQKPKVDDRQPVVTGDQPTGQQPNVTEGKTKKKANPIRVKVKKAKIKYATLKNKAKTVSGKRVFKVKKAIGKLTYSKVSGNKRITVYKKGKIKVGKGIKKGTYKIKVKIMASGSKNYAKASKTVDVIVIIE